MEINSTVWFNYNIFCSVFGAFWLYDYRVVSQAMSRATARVAPTIHGWPSACMVGATLAVALLVPALLTA